jgi:hypothetical protein
MLSPRLKTIQRPPCAQQRLLHQILRVMGGSEHSVAMHLKRVPVRVDELTECPFIARLCGGQQKPLVPISLELIHCSSPRQTPYRPETHRSPQAERSSERDYANEAEEPGGPNASI